jgi:hypothetical protein
MEKQGGSLRSPVVSLPAHFCPWGLGRRRTSRWPLASVLLDMSAIRIKYTLRLAPTSPLLLWTARHGPSRKPRDPGRGESSLMLPSAGSKLIASAGWRPSRCLNTSVMHPRAKWERGGHPLVQEKQQQPAGLNSQRVTTHKGTVPRYGIACEHGTRTSIWPSSTTFP